MANDEIEHLAKVAERERIARDLHDLLGHTLSLITLKGRTGAQAGGPRSAARQAGDAGCGADFARRVGRCTRSHQRLSRPGSCRRIDSGAPAPWRPPELRWTATPRKFPLSPAQESVLALALREAVTNVVRHAQAQRCSVRLRGDRKLCTLEIADNGRGADAPEGNGLRGMRERLEAIGGSLQRQTQAGTRLVINLPLAAAASALRN